MSLLTQWTDIKEKLNKALAWSNHIISKTPLYIELEYITNTSSGYQYIDTGFKPNNNTQVFIDISNTDEAAYWFGAWNIAYNNGAYSVCNDGYAIYAGYDGQGGAQGSILANTSTITTVKLDKNKVYVGSTLRTTFNVSAFQVNYNLYLFCQNRKGTAAWRNDGGNHSFKLHGCKIYDNGTLVRDFIPVKKVDNNVVCLYDKVSKEFFTNAGSGNFTAGPIKS